jgi:EAL domain-containing protein (putative c-di-GMP-specific phosphodiesterase class I)
MQDIVLAVVTMEELRGLGVRLSIDDFGTGYSSLSTLKNFPVSRLKIDRSFIDGLLADGNDKAVAGAVISWGQTLNLRVIAEGVETDAQAAFLRSIHCDEMRATSSANRSRPRGSKKCSGRRRADSPTANA